MTHGRGRVVDREVDREAADRDVASEGRGQFYKRRVQPNGCRAGPPLLIPTQARAVLLLGLGSPVTPV
jgi:hypothetical protein